MKFTSLNHIVKSVLNQKGYSIHWYYQYLKYATDCLRELHFSTLRVIQTRKIPVNAYNAFPAPCNMVDWVKVGLPNGQFVRPLVQHDGINRLNNFDDDGNITTYSGTQTTGETTWAETGYWDVVVNDYGEHLGRNFGHRNSNIKDGFKFLPEREEFQLSEAISAEYAILEFISDGTELSDAATKVDALAQRAIETYVIWKGSKNRDNDQSPEANGHWAAVRVLRARKDPLKKEDIVRAMNRSRTAGPK
jgi:hypothetical protein